MHLPNITTATLDDLIEPVDLGQAPAEIAGALLLRQRPRGARGGVARRSAAAVPELRLASLRDLRHPMSVDLWMERAGGARR